MLVHGANLSETCTAEAAGVALLSGVDRQVVPAPPDHMDNQYYITLLHHKYPYYTINRTFNQGLGAGAARSRGIWLEPEPSLWPGSGSTLNICLIIHENCMELNII